MARLTGSKLNTLKLVLYDLQCDEIRAVEKVATSDFVTTDEYKEKISVLLDTMSRHKKLKVFGLRKIIVIITAVTLILALAITAVAYREEIADFFETYFDDGLQLEVDDQEYIPADGRYVITRIPEGFEETYSNQTKLKFQTEWTHGDEFIYLEQTVLTDGYQVNIDTESEHFKKENIFGITVYYTYKHGVHTAVWKNERYGFSLDCECDISWEEIKLLILSMKVEPLTNE